MSAGVAGLRTRVPRSHHADEQACASRVALGNARICVSRGRPASLLREHAHDVILFIGTDGRVVEANRAAEEAYGYTRDELRADPVEEVLVDLHHVLDSAVNLAQSELRDRARIERCYGELVPVRGSTSRLGQVFLNLVVNGAQAIAPEHRDRGVVRITTSTSSDGWACIAIADNGVGIGSEAQKRLFVPFHTTKPGEGTGLGLYITRSIVEAHGGTIELESEEGAGTTVRVRLPPYEPSLDRKRSSGGASSA